MKKILAIILCLCCFVLCGCQTAPQYILEQNSEGNVTQTVYLPFTVRELMNYGLDVASASEIANNLKGKFDTYFINRYINFETKLLADETLSMEDKLYIKSCCPTMEDMKGKGQIFGNSENSGIIYVLEFKNVIAYYYFNMSYNYDDMIEELEKDDSVTKENFLTKNVVSSGETIYGVYTDLSEELTFAEYVTQQSKEILLSYGMTENIVENIIPKQYVYRYGTASKRLHSNADKVFAVDDVYYHEWTIDVQNSTREIVTWRTYAKPNMWYIVALGLTVVLVGVLSVASIIESKKLKKQEKVD